jgi:hypothetical protein
MYTQTDTFILSEMNRARVPGEEIVTWAYLVPPVSSGRRGIGGAARTFVNAATQNAVFAIITNRRLLLVKTRIGAFAPILENHGVESFELSAIRGAAVGSTLVVELANGTLLEYQVDRSNAHVSRQNEFIAQVESLLGRSDNARAMLTAKKRTQMIGLWLGVALAVGYSALRFYALHH